MPATPDDPGHVQQVASLHHVLRRALAAHLPPGATAPDVACALMYEVASIVGALSHDDEEAETVLTGLLTTALAQVRNFGVGKVHP